jgi:hypothetical protein
VAKLDGKFSRLQNTFPCTKAAAELQFPQKYKLPRLLDEKWRQRKKM